MVTDECPGTDVRICLRTSGIGIRFSFSFMQAICAGDMNHFDLSTEAFDVVS